MRILVACEFSAVEGRYQRVWLMPKSENRWRERSRTLEGIARAMADQWGAPNKASSGRG